MKTHSQATRNQILAGIGLASLLIYVLACTSFSPNDRQVLYPAFDAPHGVMSAMVYDRKTHKDQPVYETAQLLGPGETNRPDAGFLRPEWLPDGKHILVAYQAGDKASLELIIVPFGVPEPVRSWRLPDLGSDDMLVMPLPIVGSEVFIPRKNQSLLAVNLHTGAVRSGQTTNQFWPLAEPAGNALFGWADSKEDGVAMLFGRVDLRTLTLEPLVKVPKSSRKSEVKSLALTANGMRLWVVSEVEAKGQMELRVFGAGKLEFSRRIETGSEDCRFGPLGAVAPKGNIFYTSFMRTESGTTNVAFGLVELALGEAPPRWTTLGDGAARDESDALVFQGGLSHDGRYWAASSAYLVSNGALFLVDLGNPQRRVTTIPIPTPPRRE